MREEARSSAVPPRTLLALGAMSLVLAASTSPSSAATELADDLSAITLIEQRALDIKDSELIALSPDGEKIAVSRPAGPQPTEHCVRDVATLTEHVCADVSGLDAGLWPDSVVWSPGSEWLAFGELWPQFGLDGDLWLMDVSSGVLTNLLDDGYSSSLGWSESDEGPGSKRVVTLPSHPTFTPDSTAVTFSRTTVRAGEFMDLDIATVRIAGGEAVRLGGSEREAQGFDYLGKYWTTDGSRLFVTFVEHGASGLGPDSGIWVFEANGRHARQLLSITGPDDWPPRILAVSPRGEHLLVVDPRAAGGRTICACSLVDGSTGAAEPIEPLGSEANQSTPVTGAMLSPDGSLLITISGSHGRQVAVRDVATSDETVLLWEPSGAAPSDLAGEVLTWAQDDTVLVSGGRRGRGTLLVLDRGDD